MSVVGVVHVASVDVAAALGKSPKAEAVEAESVAPERCSRQAPTRIRSIVRETDRHAETGAGDSTGGRRLLPLSSRLQPGHLTVRSSSVSSPTPHCCRRRQPHRRPLRGPDQNRGQAEALAADLEGAWAHPPQGPGRFEAARAAACDGRGSGPAACCRSAAGGRRCRRRRGTSQSSQRRP